MSALRRFNGQGHCGTHGAYEYTATQVGSSVLGRLCPQCMALNHARAEAKNAASDAARQDREWQQRLRAAGIPDLFLGATLDSYLPTNTKADRMLKFANDYTGNFGGVLAARLVSGVVFVGVPGAGKTHIACGMVSKLLRMRHSAAYLSCPQFLLAAKEALYGRSEERATTLIDRYVRPQFLVLDEFGTHTTQDADYQMLFSVVDGRYQRNLPTMLVTNLTLVELSGTLTQTGIVDQRFMERIRGEKGAQIAFDWPTHRRSNAHVRA